MLGVSPLCPRWLLRAAAWLWSVLRGAEPRCPVHSGPKTSSGAQIRTFSVFLLCVLSPRVYFVISSLMFLLIHSCSLKHSVLFFFFKHSVFECFTEGPCTRERVCVRVESWAVTWLSGLRSKPVPWAEKE